MIARSLIVGMPSGRCLPSAFGIKTRFTGLALYSDQLIAFNSSTALLLSSSVVHKILSIPLVFPPLLLVTVLTAMARVAYDVVVWL